jgi:hypothetical protein
MAGHESVNRALLLQIMDQPLSSLNGFASRFEKLSPLERDRLAPLGLSE